MAESFVLVAPGQAVENGTDRVILRDLIQARVDQLSRAVDQANAANTGRMAPDAKATTQEMAAKAQEARAQRLQAIAEDRPRLAELTTGAIAHMDLPQDHLQAISEAIQSGNQRLQDELYVLRRFVEGPTGQVEVAYSLHRWTADAPRPKSGELGPGSDSSTIASLASWTSDREEVRQFYGVDVAEAHGFGEDAFADRGLESDVKEISR